MTIYRQERSVVWLNTPEGTIWVGEKGGEINTRSEYDGQDTPFGVDLQLLFDGEDENLFRELGHREVCAQELIDNLDKKKPVSRWRSMALRFRLYDIVKTERYKHLSDDVDLQIDFARESL